MINVRHAGLGILCALALVACGKGEKAKEAGTEPAATAPAANTEEKVVNVYNWSDYIAEDTIAKFEKETGIKVNYDVFDSNEVLETKLLAGNSGYDVVVPSASFLERQIKAGVFRSWTRSKLPNLSNMDPEIMQRVALHDPGNRVRRRLHVGHDGHRLQRGQDRQGVPERAGRQLGAGVRAGERRQVQGLRHLGAGRPVEITTTVLAYLGKDPNSQSTEDLAQVEAKLLKMRPYIRYIHSSQYIDDLANGEICVAVGWSGDILQARDRADEAKNNITEVCGSQGRHDHLVRRLAIPKDAPHPDNAHALINFMMEPEVAGSHQQRRQLCQRQQGLVAFRQRRRQERSGRISPAGSEGEALSRPGGDARVHAPSESHLDALHDGEVSDENLSLWRRSAGTGKPAGVAGDATSEAS